MSATTDAAINHAASAVSAATGKVATSASEILQTYLVKALDATGNVIDKAVDLVQTQAPLLVQEVLKWYFAYNLILFICGLAVIGLSLYLAQRVRKWIGGDHPDGFELVPAAMVLVVGTLISTALINLQWLKIWIAPRLWLIEYTTNLVKTGMGH